MNFWIVVMSRYISEGHARLSAHRLIFRHLKLIVAIQLKTGRFQSLADRSVYLYLTLSYARLNMSLTYSTVGVCLWLNWYWLLMFSHLMLGLARNEHPATFTYSVGSCIIWSSFCFIWVTNKTAEYRVTEVWSTMKTMFTYQACKMREMQHKKRSEII